MATNENRPARRAKRVAPASSDPADPPPRRWGRALVWLGLFAALVVIALAVSLRADDDDDVLAEPPADQPTFCATATGFDSVSSLDFDSGGLEELRRLSTVATELAAGSPDEIAEDLQAVGDALERVAVTVEAIPPDDPTGLVRITESLDRELGPVAEQGDEAGAYIERWCGPRSSRTTVVEASNPSTTPSTSEGG